MDSSNWNISRSTRKTTYYQSNNNTLTITKNKKDWLVNLNDNPSPPQKLNQIGGLIGWWVNEFPPIQDHPNQIKPALKLLKK